MCAPTAVADIEDLHRDAILRRQSTYVDPPTGFTVFTALPHLKRGRCCGNRCRHCPYGWSNVRGATEGGDEARAISGDREGTRRLVERIMKGTYYEEDGGAGGERAPTRDARAVAVEHDPTSAGESCDGTDGVHRHGSHRYGDAPRRAPAHAANGAAHMANSGEHGRGGIAGGTLTTKNVPYTRMGDGGTAQLFTGERRAKDDDLFEALGTVDELCAVAGVVHAELIAARERKLPAGPAEGSATDVGAAAEDRKYSDLPEQLLDVMSRLFDIGSLVARPAPAPGDDVDADASDDLHPRHAARLEVWIDAMTDALPELTHFVLPTGSPAAARLHVARTVCRRAERRLVSLAQGEDGAAALPGTRAYMNRLSDYFFAAARFVNYCDEREEVQYRCERDEGARDGGQRGAPAQRERVVVKLN